jgi:N-acetylglucosamine malate deacetylase 1
MNSNKVDILAFGAHPDDVECAAAGVLLKHLAMGKSVAIIDLTAGEMGSFGNVETRKNEATISSKILGIKSREMLGLPDGGIENNEAARLLVIQAIRKYQPHIVLCNALHDRHPDHANAAKLVADACFISGLKKKETYHEGKLQVKWRPECIYHYIQDYFLHPDFVIDITQYMDKKMEGIKAFKSQFVDPTDNNPGSILALIDQIKYMNSIYGRPLNVKYAEGFNVSRYLGVADFYQLR